MEQLFPVIPLLTSLYRRRERGNCIILVQNLSLDMVIQMFVNIIENSQMYDFDQLVCFECQQLNMSNLAFIKLNSPSDKMV